MRRSVERARIPYVIPMCQATLAIFGAWMR